MIAVAYYTNNTPYVKLVPGFKQSCQKFNIPHKVYGIDSQGNWIKNTQYKAVFLKDTLNKLKQPILYVDIDAKFMGFPELIPQLEQDTSIDIAVNYAYRRYVSGDELASGTIYLPYKDTTNKILDLWIEENNKTPAGWDQRTLQKVLAGMPGINIYRLPMEYCHIFDDNQYPVDHPIICHFQASRKFRN